MTAATRTPRTYQTGQRVKARYGRGNARLGVVTGLSINDNVMVQFEPCGSHFSCHPETVSAYGNADGWTEQEYRIARESADIIEHAAACERERSERFPDKAFSPLHEDWAQGRAWSV